jgi:hypothetical protein
MALQPLKQNQISDLPNLTDYDLENIFSVYLEKGVYFYNLLNTMNFPTPSNLRPDLYGTYTVKQHDIWPRISYKLYGSVSIWWLLCILNQIQNPLIMPEPGTEIFVFTSSAVNQVLQAMNS